MINTVVMNVLDLTIILEFESPVVDSQEHFAFLRNNLSFINKHQFGSIRMFVLYSETTERIAIMFWNFS